MPIPDHVRTRVENAWQRFRSRADQAHQKLARDVFQKAHQNGRDALAGNRPKHRVAHEFAHAWSIIMKDAEALTEHELAEPKVHPDGTIWGFGEYEQLDPGWACAAAEWLEHGLPETRARFGTDPQTIQITDGATLAILGDWGTGPFDKGSSEKVAAAVSTLEPDYTIHLGDVYYAGTASEERSNLSGFPAGSRGSITLNSNHEMYNGGHGYFEVALGRDGKPTPFAAQQGTSYLVLTSPTWTVVALDSVYHGSWEDMYLSGALDDGQMAFLAEHAAAGRKLLILSHHQGLSERDGSPNEPLWSQVTGQLPSGTECYWYWGHVHAGMVYKPRDGVLGRCAGHGAIPWGLASEMDQNPAIEWFEQRPSPQDPTVRVVNGFAFLKLNSDGLDERFVDEDGRVSWQRSPR